MINNSYVRKSIKESYNTDKYQQNAYCLLYKKSLK